MTFKAFLDGDNDLVIMDKCLMPSGMTVQIEFQLYDLDNVSVANVYLNVYKKRKQIPNNILKQTGKDGLKPMFWAARKIKEFEEYAKKELTNPLPSYIQVYWEDNRRARIYKHFLPRLGFRLKNFGKGEMLYKKIETANY